MKRAIRLLFTATTLAGAGCAPKEVPPPPAAEKSEAEGQREKYFGAAIAADPAVDWRSSGLGVKILAPGEGAPPQFSDRVRLHYTGRLVDGTVFDDTRAKNRPAELAISRMMRGMAEGVARLKPGGRALLHVPPSLGYGRMPVGKIPPNSGLIFDVELLAVLPPE